MIGPRGTTESSASCIEITYNYGKTQYDAAKDIHHIDVLDCDGGMLERAAAAGYTCTNGSIVDPDGLVWQPIPADSADAPASATANLMLTIHIRGSNLDKWHAWLTSAAIGMEARDGGRYGYPGDGTSLCIQQADEVVHGEAYGRLAIETEDGAPDLIAKAQDPSRILHGPFRLEQSHNELVVIVTDPVDSYEVCFVEASGFKKCIEAAARYNTVPWGSRKARGADQV